MKIIINADDLGYSIDRNQAIFSLMEHNRITSATLMANGKAFHDAVKHILNFSDISFGIHLTLTEFPSLTQPNIFFETKLIDDKGFFTDEIRRLHPSLALKDAILKEWEHQVIKIVDHGIPISHIDSHQHIHTIPWLFTTLKKLQRKFNIRKVRTTMNWYYRKEYRPSRKLLLNKKVWHFLLRKLYRTNTTNYFTSFRWFLRSLLDGEIDSRRFSGVVELMCHPGNPQNIEETELLYSDWMCQFPFNIELISYNQL